MTEKSKILSNKNSNYLGQLNQSMSIDKQHEKPESDKQFLERTNVKGVLNSLLQSLYSQQPEDPISYICN